MKFSLIGPTYPFRGGISHYTTLLYRHLRKRHEVEFFAFKRQYPQWLFPGETDVDPSQIRIQAKGVKRMLDSMNPMTWLWVAWKIKKSDPDIVIIPWWTSFWAPQFWTISLITKIFCNSKILFLCHNVVEHESKPIDKILTGYVLKKGDSFIVHSTEDQQNLLSILPNTKVKRTFHPTYDVFNIDSLNPNAIREEYGIEGNIILFFGFIREYKGLKYLIRALPEVLSKVDVTLLVVGEFWGNKAEYLSLITELGLERNIVLVDEYIPNEEVGLYFAAADIVVQPYISATGSGIIQIAFGFDKPVVATRVGSLPEVVEHGKTGYLVSPKSSSEIATAILTFFQNKKAEVFSRNIAEQSKRFSWDHLIDVIEELASA
jgi:glycosyltransferase involved in cell wall biosynthesis